MINYDTNMQQNYSFKNESIPNCNFFRTNCNFQLKYLILSKIKREKVASSIIYKSIYGVFIIKFTTQILILFKFHKTDKKTIGFS